MGLPGSQNRCCSTTTHIRVPARRSEPSLQGVPGSWIKSRNHALSVQRYSSACMCVQMRVCMQLHVCSFSHIFRASCLSATPAPYLWLFCYDAGRGDTAVLSSFSSSLARACVLHSLGSLEQSPLPVQGMGLVNKARRSQWAHSPIPL